MQDGRHRSPGTGRSEGPAPTTTTVPRPEEDPVPDPDDDLPSTLERSAKKIQHFFHLAAIYDMTASAESQRAANIDGTQHALDLAARHRHLTAGQAGALAAAGSVGTLVLTHFSARYDDVTPLLEQARARAGAATVVAARDLDRIPLPRRNRPG